jgi:hypothetical protein
LYETFLHRRAFTIRLRYNLRNTVLPHHLTDQDAKQATPPGHEEAAEDVGIPVIDNERNGIEDADSSIDDNKTKASEKSEDSVIGNTMLKSKPRASKRLVAKRHFLMFDANQRIKLTESPANYVIFLYNKAVDFFAGLLQVPTKSPHMENGVRHFYATGGCSNLKWLIYTSNSTEWCEDFGVKILDFLSSGDSLQ